MLKFTVNAAPVTQMLAGHEKQIPFTVSKAVNAAAQDAVKAGTASIPLKFDRPTSFTQKALTFEPATKANLTATVYAKDAQAEYLKYQEDGGTRANVKGKPVLYAAAQRLNQHGNIPRGAVARALSRSDVFEAKKGDPNTRHLKPGVYVRPGGRGNKRGAAPKLLVARGAKAEYKPRFGLADTVKQAVHTNFQKRLEEAVAFALNTAR
jgi:hypothetical protein